MNQRQISVGRRHIVENRDKFVRERGNMWTLHGWTKKKSFFLTKKHLNDFLTSKPLINTPHHETTFVRRHLFDHLCIIFVLSDIGAVIHFPSITSLWIKDTPEMRLTLRKLSFIERICNFRRSFFENGFKKIWRNNMVLFKNYEMPILLL